MVKRNSYKTVSFVVTLCRPTFTVIRLRVTIDCNHTLTSDIQLVMKRPQQQRKTSRTIRIEWQINKDTTCQKFYPAHSAKKYIIWMWNFQNSKKKTFSISKLCGLEQMGNDNWIKPLRERKGLSILLLPNFEETINRFDSFRNKLRKKVTETIRMDKTFSYVSWRVIKWYWKLLLAWLGGNLVFFLLFFGDYELCRTSRTERVTVTQVIGLDMKFCMTIGIRGNSPVI